MIVVPPPRRFPRLADLPARFRLAIAAFLAGILLFYGFAQLKVITTVGSGTEIPGPSAILRRYHGDAAAPKLVQVLDPKLPETDARRMYGWLGTEEPERVTNRALLLGWVERGAKAAEWGTVSPVFAKCTSCHSTTAEGTGTRPDLPFDRYADVLPVVRTDDGMAFSELATTSHNHLFGFLVGALLVSLIFGLTRWRGPLASLLILGAFAGGIVDVLSWWATKYWGAPFHLLVFAGGAAFGLCLAGMSVLALDELLLRGRLGSLLEKPLLKLRLARREDW